MDLPLHNYLTNVLGLDEDRAVDVLCQAPVENAFASDKQRKWYFANHGAGKGGPSGGKGGAFLLGSLKSGYSDERGNQLTVLQAARQGKTTPLSGRVGDDYYTKTLGHDAEDYEYVKGVLSDHGSVESIQKVADAKLADLMYADSSKGRVLRGIADTETAMLKEFYDGHSEREQSAATKFRKDNEGYFMDKEEVDQHVESMTGYPPPSLYRGGSVGEDKVESWTTDPRGASKGAGQGRFAVHHERDIGEMLDEGYVSLGGIGRMMGAPGESEITMFKPSRPLANPTENAFASAAQRKWFFANRAKLAADKGGKFGGGGGPVSAKNFPKDATGNWEAVEKATGAVLDTKDATELRTLIEDSAKDGDSLDDLEFRPSTPATREAEAKRRETAMQEHEARAAKIREASLNPNAPGGKDWVPPPEKLYHATYAADEIAAGGFKTAEQLGPSSDVLGGTKRDSVSFTTKANAEKYRDGLDVARRAAQGEIDPNDFDALKQIGQRFGVPPAEMRKIVEANANLAYDPKKQMFGILQGVSFAGKQFPLFMGGNWTETVAKAKSAKLVEIDAKGPESWTYHSGETEWRIGDAHRIAGVRVVDDPTENAFASAKQRRWYFANKGNAAKTDKGGIAKTTLYTPHKAVATPLDAAKPLTDPDHMTLADADPSDVLQSVPVTDLKSLGTDKNTNAVFVGKDPSGEKVVFKPSLGESFEFDEFCPQGTLANREIASSVVNDALGNLGRVPKTTRGQNDEHGGGAVRRFSDGEETTKPPGKVWLETKTTPQHAAEMTAFDLVTGNVDRHRGNFLVQEDGSLVGFDNGFSAVKNQHLSAKKLFGSTQSIEATLRGEATPEIGMRTALADKLPEKLPAAVVAKLEGMKSNRRAVEKKLEGLLEPEEITSMFQRLDAVLHHKDRFASSLNETKSVVRPGVLEWFNLREWVDAANN